MKLRYYQEDCVKAIENMDINQKGVVCLSTGSGKTVILSEVTRRATGRVLIVVMNTELREQSIDKLKMICGDNVDVGSVQGALKEYDNRIIVATRQTLTSKGFNCFRLLEKGCFETILFDECHVAIEQQQTICLTYGAENARIIGLTATPYNLDMRYLYDGIIYKKELIDMINEGYLVKPVCIQCKSDTNVDDIKIRYGDFSQKELGEKLNNEIRNKLVVQSYIDNCQDRNKTLVFATTVEHSKAIAECFNQNGISAKSIDGSCTKKERKNILKAFENGSIKVLVNVNVCTVGLDIPSIDSIIFARCTKSKGLYIQMLGRGLRLSPETNKDDCLVIDIVDVTTKHNIINGKTVFDVQYDVFQEEKKTEKVIKKKEIKKEVEEVKEEEKKIEYIKIDIQPTGTYTDSDILADIVEKGNVFIKSAKKKIKSMKEKLIRLLNRR